MTKDWINHPLTAQGHRQASAEILGHDLGFAPSITVTQGEAELLALFGDHALARAAKGGKMVQDDSLELGEDFFRATSKLSPRQAKAKAQNRKRRQITKQISRKARRKG